MIVTGMARGGRRGGFYPNSLAPNAWWTCTGASAGQWDDVSGNGRHMVQATVAAQPSIIANVRNGKQARRFGTNSVFFNSNVAVPSQGNLTLFAVVDYASVDPSVGWECVLFNGLPAVGNTGASAQGQLGLQRRELTNEFGCHNSGVANVGVFVSLGATFLDPRIVMIRRSNSGTTGNGGTITIRSNNSIATGTQSWDTAVNNSSMQIGGKQQSSFVSPFIGDIFDAMVFSRALSDAEIAMVFTYYSTLYAITL